MTTRPRLSRWYRHAVIYCVDVDSFADANGDGHGDLPGLIARLPHLARLGVTCLWLNPIHPTPNRDDGYDVADYYDVDPRLGTLGDVVELIHEAGDLGIRVIMDLVVNHTSDEHPWFCSARSDPDSPYRDWYIWSSAEPADRFQGVVFPGEQEETWTWDEQAQAWYFHRFYDFQPDLNWRNPAVRAEVLRVMGFWVQLGMSGFRVDAAPFVIELVAPDEDPAPHDFGIIDEWRQFLQWRRGDAILLGEANVSPQDVSAFFGSSPVAADRMHLLFDFVLNPRIFLALAREDAEPLAESLTEAVRVPSDGQWATFLRNHDELDLSRLTQSQRAEVFDAFAPRPQMRLFNRGIRRRLAPILGNDRQRLELAYALQFSLPGTPVIRYGEEIGMGENLAAPGRDAIRTPMQWSAERNGGFSTARREDLVVAPIGGGPFGFRKVNVRAQRQDPSSLLSWMQRLIAVRQECPEIGEGSGRVVPLAGVPSGVLVHRVDGEAGSLVFLHNLSGQKHRVDLSGLPGLDGAEKVLSDHSQNGEARGRFSDDELPVVELAPFGYRWLRLPGQTHAG